jgi:aromatic ring-cleaving dioxygenase
MRYNLYLLLLLTMVVGSIGAQTPTKQFRVNFNVNEHALDKKDEATLNELLLLCKKTPYAEISLTAHTDIDASDEYNLALSKRRAEAVTGFLDANQVNTKNIRVNWYGEKMPDASNDNEEGKAVNRRVDILVKLFNINNTAELLKTVSPEYLQTFTIDPKKDNTIRAKNGTLISIPKGSLVDKNGKPVQAKSAQIAMKEFLNPRDAAFNQLSTMSNGKMLESGGMFTVVATSANGEELKLKKGQTIKVKMPSTNIRNDMQLFTEVKNALGVSEWKPANVPFRPMIRGPKTIAFVNLDTKKLKALQVRNSQPTSPVEFAYALPKTPVKPDGIGDEPTYKEPTLESEFSWWQRFFLPDSWLQKKLDVIIAKRKKHYNKLLAKYLEKKAAYEPVLAQYQLDSARFEQEELAKLRCWLADQKALHQQMIVYLEKEQWNDALQDLIWLSNTNGLNNATFKEHFIADVNPNFSLAAVQATSNISSSYRINRNRVEHNIAVATITQIEQKSMAEIVKHWNKENQLNLLMVKRNYLHTAVTPNSFIANKKSEQEAVVAMLEKAQIELAKKQEDAKKFDESNVGNVYATSLSEFGTFNCDRFSSTPEEQMAKITVPYKGEARVSFFVPSLNSYIYAEKNDDGYFTTLPKNMEIKVVFVSFTATDGPIIDIKTTRFTKNTIVELQPKSVTLKEMEQKLASI